MKSSRLEKKTKCIISVLLVVVAILAICAALFMRNVRPPEIAVVVSGEEDEVVHGEKAEILRREDFFTVLVAGVDAVSNSTDIIMLAALDCNAKKMSVMSIPRDTITNTKRANKKINAAYAAGGGEIEALYDEVESVTGVRPDKYLLVTVDGFVDVIDAIGGVEVDVPIDMVYNDPAQDLEINIKKGLQILDGYDSMGFLRYRKTYAEGDIGRIKMQHSFMDALMEKMFKPATLVKIPDIAEIIQKNVETDLTLGNEIWIGRELVSMNREEDVILITLPGQAKYYNGLSYYFPEEEDVLGIINESFNPYVEPIEKLHLFKR